MLHVLDLIYVMSHTTHTSQEQLFQMVFVIPLFYFRETLKHLRHLLLLLTFNPQFIFFHLDRVEVLICPALLYVPDIQYIFIIEIVQKSILCCLQ